MAIAFATCDLCDVHKGDSTGDFRVLPPVFQDFGAVKKFAGPVFTVKCYEDNTLVKAAVDAGAAAAKTVGTVRSAHVIARPHDDVEALLERPPVR